MRLVSLKDEMKASAISSGTHTPRMRSTALPANLQCKDRGTGQVESWHQIRVTGRTHDEQERETQRAPEKHTACGKYRVASCELPAAMVRSRR